MRIVLLSTLLAACGARDIEAENGFRGLGFGDSTTAHSTLQKWRDEGPGHISYVRTDEVLSWNEATLGRVEYHFYDDEMFRVIVRSGDPQDMLDVMKREYGTPPYNRPWEWGADRVTMKLTGSNIDKNCTITIWDNAVEAKRKAQLRRRLDAQDKAYGEVLRAKTAESAEGASSP